MSEFNPQKINELMAALNWEKFFSLFIGIIIIGLLVRALKFLISSFQEQFPGSRIFLAQIQAIISYFIYIIGGTYLIYKTVNPTKEMMLAITGSAAVAIGFSLKDLVSSIIAGMILILDRPFQVGDRISHADTYGDVISIGLRAIRVKTLNDNIVTIPNSKFITESVSSANDGEIDMQVACQFYFLENCDFQELRDDLYEIAATSKFVFLKKGVSITMKEHTLENDIYILVTIKAYVLDIEFEKELETDLTLRVQKYKKKLFNDKNEIS